MRNASMFLMGAVMLAPVFAGAQTVRNEPSSETQLVCEQTASGSLKGHLYDTSRNPRVKLSTFGSNHVAGCELARRSARRGRVCIERNGGYHLFDIKNNKILTSFGSGFDACLESSKEWVSLATTPGFMEFIDPRELVYTLKNLPAVANPGIDEVLRSAKTIWYDDDSMIFSYQDSFGRPKGPEGLRANRVAYDVGINSSEPSIKFLTNFFELGRFKFPFAVLSGRQYKSNTYGINFWAPPRDASGKALPVIWWETGSHWNWVFPVGTVIGEVLMTRSDDSSEWYVFEIRSRTRELSRWKTEIFRPFTQAQEFADFIKDARPNWRQTDLARLVDSLEDQTNLVAAKLSSTPYQKIFKEIKGYYDVLPGTNDVELIKDALSKRTFQPAMNTAWKESGDKKTFAPTTNAGFHIVPQGNIAGLLETTETACQNCHVQTGRPLKHLDGQVQAYGEIWGEDQIFTWHPFEIVKNMFTVSDGSRKPNSRMVQAGLLAKRKPSASESSYRELVRPYPQDYATH